MELKEIIRDLKENNQAVLLDRRLMHVIDINLAILTNDRVENQFRLRNLKNILSFLKDDKLYLISLNKETIKFHDEEIHLKSLVVLMINFILFTIVAILRKN